MRTEEQILNLRHVFSMTFGPIAFLAPDIVINKWADALERLVNMNDNRKHIWDVKIKTDDNHNASWFDIKKEPTSPYASYMDIGHKCYDLLDKYPTIVAIQISDSDDFRKEYVITRKEPQSA